MIGENDSKITIDDFKGLYSRGSVDEVPIDHAQDCLNLAFSSSGHCRTRDGLTKSLVIPHSGIRRFFLMEWTPMSYLAPIGGNAGASEGKQLLHLDNANNLYIGNYAVALFNVAGMTDFAAINMANRVYVSPNNGIGGFQKGRLQVVDPAQGASTIRDAAGPAPEQATGLNAAVSATVGVISPGTHKFAVIYETDTGYWTQPGPKIILAITAVTLANPCVMTVPGGHGMITGESHKISGFTGAWIQVNDIWHVTRIDNTHFSIPVDTSGLGGASGTPVVSAVLGAGVIITPGGFKCDLSNIPVGPSYVKRRLILATRANETEYFFVPSVPGSQSEINDNVTTTTTVDFLDTDLVASADYLFDNLEAIPGGSAMCKYRGRLIIVGPYLPGIQERVLVSNINDPETFSWVSGYVQVQSERDGNDVRSCYVLRDTLYLAKFTGTFSTEDNGRNPSTWAVSVVDAVIGSYGYGTSTFTVSQGAPDTGDIVLVASRPGLYLFDGVMRRPELTWKIQNEWLRINFAYFHRVTVAHDPWNHLIFVSCPFDNATEPNILLVGDYSGATSQYGTYDGRNPDRIRWCKWQLQKSPTCIGMAYFGSSISPTTYTLKIGSIDAFTPNLYSLTSGATNDDGGTISSFYTPGPLAFGGVGCFKYIIARARGVGKLNLTLSGLDNVLATVPPFFTLTPLPGREFYRGINFVNEKMNLELRSGYVLNDYMILERIDIYGLTLWQVRPTV